MPAGQTPLLFWIILTAVLTQVISWFFFRILLRRRSRSLLAAIERLASGDLSSRPDLSSGPGEMDKLASGLAGLAARLEERENRRREEENTLHRERDFCQAMIESLPGVFFIFDPEFRMLRWNRNLEEVTGLAAADISAMRLTDFIAPGGRERARMKFGHALCEGSAALEANLLTRDGGEAPYYFSVSRLAVNGRPCIVGSGVDVMERKLAETEKDRLIALIEHATMFMGLATLDGKVIYVNEAGRRLVGLSPHEVRQTSIEDFAAAGMRDEMERVVTPLLRTTGSWSGETRWRHFRTGKTIDIELFTFLINDRGTGLPKWIAAVAQDITTRKQAEDALRISEREFRSIFDLSAVGKAQVDPATGLFTRVNRKFCEITGYEERDLLRMTVSDITHPLDRQRGLEAFERTMSGTADTWEIEERYVRRDGRTIWARLNGALIRDGDGRPLRALAVIQDVTASRQAEEALKESERRFASFMRHLPGIAFIKTPEGRYLFVNETIDRIFGKTFRELYGKRDDELFTPEVAARLLAGDRRVIEQTAPVETIEAMPEAGGTRSWLVVKFPILGADGEVAMIAGVGIDVSERQRAENELREAKTRLQAVSRSLMQAQETERRRIARELHDEIGQQLTAAKISLHAATSASRDPQVTENVREAAGRVDEVLSGVRSLSLMLRPSVLDDLGLVPALRWHLNRVRQQSSLNVSLFAGEDVGRLPAEVETSCFRVAQEAVTNAIRHGRADRIVVDLRRLPDAVNLAVHDNGAGFDVEKKFRQAVRGESFGLLGMQERATLAGGVLTVTSTPGQGTLVEARYPIP